MENSLTLYLRTIGQYPLLTKEQEIELGRRIKEEHDAEAREKMINCNLRLVVSVAKSFRSSNHNIPLEDLIEEGNYGLMTAVEKYDYTRGLRFSTCAVPWIKQAIMKSIVDTSRAVRIPAHIVQKFNQYRSAIEDFCAEGNYEPTAEEIAARMKITVENLQQILQWKQNAISLDTPMEDDGAENKTTLGDLCADNDETPNEYIDRLNQHDFVMGLIEKLDPRTQAIFKLRFGLGTDNDPEEYRQEHTLEEIGDLLAPKITRERVRQIVTQQLAKWRTMYGSII